MDDYRSAELARAIPCVVASVDYRLAQSPRTRARQQRRASLRRSGPNRGPARSAPGIHRGRRARPLPRPGPRVCPAAPASGRVGRAPRPDGGVPRVGPLRARLLAHQTLHRRVRRSAQTSALRPDRRSSGGCTSRDATGARATPLRRCRSAGPEARGRGAQHRQVAMAPPRILTTGIQFRPSSAGRALACRPLASHQPRHVARRLGHPTPSPRGCEPATR